MNKDIKKRLLKIADNLKYINNTLSNEVVQKFLWIPLGIDTGTDAFKCEVPYKGNIPSRVYTLPEYTDKNNPPKLPFIKTRDNAWIESPTHDWDVMNNKFYYTSHNNLEGKVWLLLEYLVSTK